MTKHEYDNRDQDEYPQIQHESGLFPLVCFQDYFYEESNGRQGRINVQATTQSLAQRFSQMSKSELIDFGKRIEEYKLRHDDPDKLFHGSGRITSFAEIGHWDEAYSPEGYAQYILGYLYEIDNRTLTNMGERDFRETLPTNQAEGLIGRLSNRIMHVLFDAGMREDIPYLLSDGQVIYADQR